MALLTEHTHPKFTPHQYILIIEVLYISLLLDLMYHNFLDNSILIFNKKEQF